MNSPTNFELNPISGLSANAAKLLDQSQVRKRWEFSEAWQIVDQAWGERPVCKCAGTSILPDKAIQMSPSKSVGGGKKILKNVGSAIVPLHLWWMHIISPASKLFNQLLSYLCQQWINTKASYHYWPPVKTKHLNWFSARDFFLYTCGAPFKTQNNSLCGQHSDVI